ncbi:TPA: hypothetical protein KKW30_002472 [Legionella pneumophila]|nr:hypothetical protein [Legionella pneumophila]HAT5918126.1 hypothetical protein [Legionella pneumophila]HAT5921388.1 hypothetical protein [Legionella pneumophila]HAT5933836.1 hypothetical protein [Legionella pneumophila]HAT5948740.1 hypothetical protein [Legionella pneumophila]
MSLIELSDCGSSLFERLLGHAPKILEDWNQLESSFFQSTTFSPEFLEQVRRALAFNNQCQYCMAKAGPPDQNPEDNRLIEALRFANKFAISNLVDEEEIARLKKYFSDAEIVELVAFCSFISASQRIGAVLGLKESSYYSIQDLT